MFSVLTLLRKDIRLFLRNKTAFALTFIVPLVLVRIFGWVFGLGGTGGGSGPVGIPVAIVSQTDAAVASAITTAMQHESAFRVITTWDDGNGAEVILTEERARELIRNNRLRFALVFPPDTVSDDTFGLKIKYLNNPRNDIETQTVTGLLQKVIFTSAPTALMDGLRRRAENFIGTAATATFYDNLAGIIATAFGLEVDQVRADLDNGALDFGAGGSGDTDGNGATDFLNQIVNIQSEQLAGADVKSPDATRVVGGWAIMFLLFSVSGASTALFEEKQAGIFQRLLSSPVRRTHILWSKYLFNMLLGLMQLTVLFLAGQMMFGIDVTGHLTSLIPMAMAASAACTAFGMLLCSISPSPAAANGLATFLILTMSAIGGAWFPTTFMPGFIQTISHFTLVYWSVEGFLAVLWAQQSFIELLPIIGILLGMAAVVNTFSVWRFNRGNLFE